MIGQAFTTEEYFQGRLSATTASDPKDSTKDSTRALQRGQLRWLQYGPHQQGTGRSPQRGRLSSRVFGP